MSQIPWTDWGGDGPVLHLAHANGFPPGAYARLVESLLPRFHVVSMAQRPLWPGSDPRSLRDWNQLGRDLRDCLRHRGHEGIIGVGHSVGGASTLIAAARDPGLFRGVVLLDPTILGGARAFFWSIAKALGQVHRVFVVRDALNRRDRWASRDEVRASWAAKPVFARLDPRCLGDYVQAGVVDHPEGGVTLRYSKAWEARVFATTPACSWDWARRLKTPALVVRGALSDTFLPGVAARLGRLAPTARLLELEGSGHLFPLEAPERTAGVVTDFVDSLPPA
ncbi:MAG: alpha/beta hydrolase [Deltaproteobacteria bacterium]|nr:alpha/beta hydrolase [Deltaproteobacteria bacterium]